MTYVPAQDDGWPEALPAAVRDAYLSGSMVTGGDSRRYRIPSALNLLLCLVQAAVALAVLTVASHAESGRALVVAAIAFAFVMQMGFCLAHEAVHGKLQRNRRANLISGILLFTLFPGSFHFFEIAHLVHHRRNRSDAELEDYVLPGESAWLKRACYYLLICGLFWLLIPLATVIVALAPLRRISIPAPTEAAGAFRRFAQFLNEVRPSRVRRDLLVTIVFWAISAPLLHLTWPALAACYAAFAFSWASQQYIYHVRTPRHAVLGALDLRLVRPMEMLYLHFNYHLTHHLAVWVPWIYLPRIAPQRPALGYFRTYLHLWLPPERIDGAWPPQFQTSGPIPPRSHDDSAPASLMS
jgi:fatty acid desaturase